jgi:hypothetical protein
MAKSAKYVDIRPSPDAKATTPLRSLKFNAKERNGQVETGDLVFYAPAAGSLRAPNIIRVVSGCPLIRLYQNPPDNDH